MTSTPVANLTSSPIYLCDVAGAGPHRSFNQCGGARYDISNRAIDSSFSGKHPGPRAGNGNRAFSRGMFVRRGRNISFVAGSALHTIDSPTSLTSASPGTPRAFAPLSASLHHSPALAECRNNFLPCVCISPSSSSTSAHASHRETELVRKYQGDCTQHHQTMPALDSLAIATQRQVLERRNWANDNRGPVLVFVIVFIVGMAIVLIYLYRMWMRHRASREAYE
ncbi:uncharacterized protein BDV17DRAFT_90625 [Aspergillus undulatus]|uniref:uncharacterized protein n=1 Tax=Aspergillus undulatus TaxID=1810928 RepID=UPI003CCDD453